MSHSRAALLLVAALFQGCASGTAPRHSVLLVTFDTTRADRLEPYGGPSGLTPTLLGLALRGVVFEKVLAQAAVTPVAHASLFTGLNPYRHGLRTLHGNRLYRLPDEATTIAERFRELGYATAAFISAFPCSRRFGLEQGFDHFDERFALGHARVGAAGNVSTGLAQRSGRDTTNAALAWFASRPRDRPFFVWIHYFDPHDPLMRPPVSFTEPFMEGIPEHGEMDRLLTADLERFGDTYASRPDLMRPWLRRLYDAEIRFADEQLGRVIGELEGTGLLATTLVAVTADHGEGLGDHDWWGHGILYQEQIHVPLLLTGPDLRAGVRVPDRVRHIDLAPTLLDLAAGTRFGTEVQGVTLAPLIRQRSAGQEPSAAHLPGPAYADSVALMRYGAFFSQDVVEEKDDQLYVWIDGDLKWIRHRLRPGENELFDLAADADEQVNLIRKRPRDAARLDADLERELPMTDPVSLSLTEDPDAREKLRSLGYVD